MNLKLKAEGDDGRTPPSEKGVLYYRHGKVYYVKGVN
jgi:hypothetical protein